mgnify:CR=1 FL=1
MKFWNKTYNELTVKELTIWAVVLSAIAMAITYISIATDWFETAGEKITGSWNKIFHK